MVKDAFDSKANSFVYLKDILEKCRNRSFKELQQNISKWIQRQNHSVKGLIAEIDLRANIYLIIGDSLKMQLLELIQKIKLIKIVVSL